MFMASDPDLVHYWMDTTTTAKDMEADRLKREFGKDVTFWGGGVSAQTTLFSGNVENARREAKEKLEIFAPGGGYVFTTDHDIQEHVQPEVIEAVIQSVLANPQTLLFSVLEPPAVGLPLAAATCHIVFLVPAHHRLSENGNTLWPP